MQISCIFGSSVSLFLLAFALAYFWTQRDGIRSIPSNPVVLSPKRYWQQHFAATASVTIRRNNRCTYSAVLELVSWILHFICHTTDGTKFNLVHV